MVEGLSFKSVYKSCKSNHKVGSRFDLTIKTCKSNKLR